MENGTALVLRNILKKFKDDFDSCKFAYIYDIIRDYNGSASALTELLFKNNINPFKLDNKLDIVPYRFAENISGILPHKLTNDLFNNNVDAISPRAFFNCSDIHALDFKNIFIQGFAFSGCTQLETINLIYTVDAYVELGPNAFVDCKNLKNVTITIEKTHFHFRGDVFEGCDNLTEITFIGNGSVWLNSYDAKCLKSLKNKIAKIKMSGNLYMHSTDFTHNISKYTDIAIETI